MMPASVAAIVCAAGLAAGAAATAPSLDGTATCERRMATGRVVCELELETPEGRLPWADVTVTAAPPFARPLRSRVALAEARARTERRVRLPVAFVATAPGRGTASFRARAVVCLPESGGEQCRQVTRELVAELVVGPDAS